MNLKSYSEFAKKGLDLLDVIINTRNHVVYVLGLELMLHMPTCSVCTTSYDRCGVSVGERI